MQCMKHLLPSHIGTPKKAPPPAKKPPSDKKPPSAKPQPAANPHDSDVDSDVEDITEEQGKAKKTRAKRKLHMGVCILTAGITDQVYIE